MFEKANAKVKTISVDVETENQAPPVTEKPDTSDTTVDNVALEKQIIKEQPKPPSTQPVPRPAALRTTIPTFRTEEAREYPPRTYNGINFPDYRRDKDEGLDLYAFQLRANAQPLHKALQTARKTVTTHDWMVRSKLTKANKPLCSQANDKLIHIFFSLFIDRTG